VSIDAGAAGCHRGGNRPMQSQDTLPKQDQLTRGLDETRNRLVNEFQDKFQPDLIEKVVEDAFQTLKDSSVSEFVPLFVYRSARQQLADLSRSARS
jgi:hypothetical protein